MEVFNASLDVFNASLEVFNASLEVFNASLEVFNAASLLSLNDICGSNLNYLPYLGVQSSHCFVQYLMPSPYCLVPTIVRKFFIFGSVSVSKILCPLCSI